MDQNLKSHNLRKFFFPLYEYKTLKQIKLLSLIAILISLRIIFGFFSVSLPIFRQTISIAWIPVMIMGWIFGPIYGMFLGFVCDTIGFIIHPTTIWFWMYAIQEPLIGFFSGIIASVCKLRRQNEHPNIIIDVLVHQIVTFGFSIISLVSILTWVDKGKIQYFEIYKNVTICLITLYLIVMECFTFYYLKNINDKKDNTLIFIYATILVSSLMMVFSFVLGPISAVEYLNYINGVYPDAWVKYGTLYYLIPRVAIESIKTPVESFLLYSLILVVNPLLNRILNQINNKW